MKHFSVQICVICGLSLSYCGQSFAQIVNLNEAIKIAMQNNKILRSEMLKAAYANAIIKTAKEIPKTNIYTEVGQNNSALFDTKFGAAQTILFPTIYKKQKQVYETDYNIAAANMFLKEFELKKAIADLYYQFQFLKEKEVLLISTDSLFTIFYNKALLRLQKGESNILEKTTAENQKVSIDLQLKLLQQEIDVLLIQFKFLLNKVDVTPFYEKGFTITSIDSIAIAKHPVLAIYEEEIKLATANTALEKEKLKPDFNIAINNTSFRGITPSGGFYNSLDRFTSLQLGIAIPIFGKSQKAKIKALQIKEKLTESNSNIAKAKLQVEFEKWISIFKSNVVILNTYNSTVLKNAALIKQVANKQFVNGEINYLDFVMLIQQAIQIESNYIEARHAVNNSILHINYITLQN